MDTFEKLKEKTENHISFHTPGHNGSPKYDIKARTDITELSFSDNLLSPSGCIKKAEEFTAKIYGCDKALLFTNGATSCIHTVIASLKDKRFLVIGEAHKSVFNILGILKSECFYTPDYENIECVIEDNKIECIFITSPNYFGDIVDYVLIQKLKDEYGVIVIIDSSHGSHFAFCHKLPISATQIGDIVIFSLHKTLPCYTGTALICAKEKYYEDLFYNRQIFHTSSPFYPSIIRAYETLIEFYKKDFYIETENKIIDFGKSLNKNFKLLKKADFTRVVIETVFSAEKTAAVLEKERIFIEMTYKNLLVLIVTSFNADYLPKVAEILNGIKAQKGNCIEIPYRQEKAKKLVYFDKTEFVSLENAKGRILAKEIGLYPPGVPIFFAGEVLDEDKIFFIKDNINSLFGLVNDRVVVVK